MRKSSPIRPGPGVVAIAAILASGLLGPAPASADSLVRARVVVNASTPSAVTLEEELHWNAVGGTPRTALTFHLSPALEVTGIASEGAKLAFRKDDAPGSPLARWTVTLPVPLAAGSTRALVVQARMGAAAGVSGIRSDADGGYLLPGSGWFARLSPESDELPPHTTEFVLPAGWEGIACGERDAAGGKWTATPGRPYAVWGAYRAEDATEGKVAYRVWRRSGSGKPEGLGKLSSLIDALTAGVDEPAGSGPWKLVDVGRGVVAGGQRTLFWDQGGGAAAGGDAALLRLRDLAGGLAAAYWQESVRFGGDQAAFLSGGISRSLGDAATIALDPADERWRVEEKVIGSRRSAFLAGRAADRALRGLAPASPEAAAVLDTRGALVAQMMADACPSTSHWISFLRSERSTRKGQTLDLKTFLADLDGRFPNQHAFIAPFLDTTDLPDFTLASHAPAKGTGPDRYRIEVANRGKAAAYAELATFTADDHMLRTTRLFIPPGETRAVMMGDASRIGRIRIDPRGATLQSAVQNESAAVTGTAATSLQPYVPAFPFSVGETLLREVKTLSFGLTGVKVDGFSGYLQWWETQHGPSGAVMLGKGTVTIAPTGPFAESFRKALGRDTMTFQAEDLFVRFPVASWAGIQPALGPEVDDATRVALAARRQFVYEHSFPALFSEGALAEVPPPGGALVIFGLGGDEWRGYSREPLPSGKVKVRLWDHLRGTTIWEATL